MFLGGLLRKYRGCMICNQTRQSFEAKTAWRDGEFDVARWSTQRVALTDLTCCVGKRPTPCVQQQRFKSQKVVKDFSGFAARS